MNYRYALIASGGTVRLYGGVISRKLQPTRWYWNERVKHKETLPVDRQRHLNGAETEHRIKSPRMNINASVCLMFAAKSRSAAFTERRTAKKQSSRTKQGAHHIITEILLKESDTMSMSGTKKGSDTTEHQIMNRKRYHRILDDQSRKSWTKPKLIRQWMMSH